MLLLFLSAGAVFPQTVRVGTTYTPPLVYSNDDGTAGGLFIDILEFIAVKENWKLEYVSGSLNECLERLEKGEIDLIADLGYSSERAKKYEFSNECVLPTWAQVYIAEGSEIISFLDLQGKRVAVEKGDYFIDDPEHGFRHKMEQLGIDCTYIEVPEYNDVFEMIDRKKAEAGIVNRIFGDIEEHNYNVVKTSIIFSPVSLRYAFRKGDARGKELCSRIDYHLSRMKSRPDSEYYQYLENIHITGPERFIPMWLIHLLIAAAAGLGIFGIMNHILKVKVKKHTRTLEEMSERYRNLVVTMEDIIYSVSSDGRILFIGPQIERYGLKSNDMMSKPFIEYIYPEDRDKLLADFGETIADGKEILSDFRITAGDGSIVWFEEIGRPVRDENGEIVSISGMLRDITQRRESEEEKKKLEDQLLQSQKMEAIGTLAGGVAHDFNNLLTVIKGHSDLSMMKLKESDPVYADIKQIKESADRAANLTRQLLLYSRREHMNYELVSITHTVKGMLKMLSRLIGEDIEIRTEFPEETWDVKADVGNLEQVIMNLSVNARDAMPEGGTLTFRTGNIHINEEYAETYPGAQTGKYVYFEIEDTGTGMDKDTMEHLFEPFFTTKGAGKGTGLGMSVAYGIVKAHDGWIHIYSEPGKGTSFKIYLPASFEKKKQKIKTNDIIRDLKGKGENILLVEDEQSVLFATQKLLEESGYTVYTAANAEEALDVFREHDGSFDLLFTDTILPDMNGLQLIEELREIRKDLPVLLSSGYTGDRVRRETIQEMDLPFIQKPYDLTGLLRIVKESMYRSD